MTVVPFPVSLKAVARLSRRAAPAARSALPTIALIPRWTPGTPLTAQAIVVANARFPDQKQPWDVTTYYELPIRIERALKDILKKMDLPTLSSIEDWTREQVPWADYVHFSVYGCLCDELLRLAKLGKLDQIR